ncbi:universal stress protein [Rhizobium gallicum]|uniref:universal stress protein n=1 Tax=Rhizobium gallicum TaxID=56730 RepID=UPI0009E1EF09|nr:universal stress protein [Rhizobium gallicum]
MTNREPAKTIIDEAAQRGCDLIAMASHGRRLYRIHGRQHDDEGTCPFKNPVLVYR